jgi:hypothetical protein
LAGARRLDRITRKGAVKNVSAPRDFWHYLGDYQPKVSRSYTPERWGSEELAAPIYQEDNLKALRLAFDLFEPGTIKEERIFMVKPQKLSRYFLPK